MEEEDKNKQNNNNENEGASAVPSKQKRFSEFMKKLPSAFVTNEDILEKLKLLNYEEKFQPIHKFYFALPGKNPEQFHYFVNLIFWIIHDKLGKIDAEPFDVYEEDPITISTTIMSFCRKFNISCDFPPNRLKQGYGDIPCFILNSLLTLCLQKSKTLKISTDVDYPDELIYNEEEEVYNEEDEDDNIIDTIENDSDEDENDYYYGDLAKDEAEEMNKNKEIIETKISEKEWKLEFMQVAPKLVVRLQVDHKDWRTHVEQMTENQKTISDLLFETTDSLQKIFEDISKINERIKKRESMLSDDPIISNLISEYQKNKEELKEVTRKYEELEQNISNCSIKLNKIQSELEKVNSKIDDQNSKISDDTPLKKIVESIKRLKKEIRTFDLRIGVLRHTLLQAKLKSKNSNYETNNQDQFDPFSDHF